MKVIFRLALAAPLFAGSAFGWGCDGHQTIALIARAHLTPAVSAAVDELLKQNPIDPALRRFCNDRPADPIADAATWADDIRSTDKTGQWHYVDIPLAVSEGDIGEWCESVGPSVDDKDRPGCVVSALKEQTQILSDKTKPPALRAQALRYVIHYAGDLSQPLHAVDNHDQGGNCTSILTPFSDRPSNLHSIWDSGIIGNELKQKQLTDAQFAASIDKEFSGKWKVWGTAPLDFEAWAWEAHKIAGAVTYGELRPAIPTAPAEAGQADKAACDAERSYMAEQHQTLSPQYIDDALPVIHRQLARGGYRLADILNQALK